MRILISLFYFFFCLFSYASLNTINYHAIITDPSGSPLSSKYVGLQFRIIEEGSGNELFIEETRVLTSEDGFVNYKIGSESSGSLLDIDWNQDNLLLEVSIDLEGKQNYSSVITSSISSVPVSFFSFRSLDGMQNADKINNLNSRVDKLEIYSNNPQVITDQNMMFYLISDCICIGDSVTEGHIYDYPNTPIGGVIERAHSYPSFLSKMTGWNIENAGFSGFSASDWWNKKFNEYDYSKYEIAILELGYNGGLTDTLEEDVISKTGFNNYADTNTGNYCKIIEGIKEKNPDIMIVLNISSLMKEGNILHEKNRSVIKKIAEIYNLPVIDLSEINEIDLNSSSYHGFTDENGALNMVHFNKLGYCAKAGFIYNALKSILKPL